MHVIRYSENFSMNAQVRKGLRKLVLAIDQGTTSTRCITYDEAGTVCGMAAAEFPQLYPKSGWVEHQPDAIFKSVIDCIDKLSLGDNDHVEAIGITNQRETVVAWDKYTGDALANAVVWLDTRTHDLVHAEAHASPLGVNKYRAITGLPLSTYFSSLKIKWLMDNVSAVKSAVDSERCYFGTIDSYLAYKLTGGKVHVTDCANASRYNLMNLSTLTWSDEICNSLGIPTHTLPRIVSNSEKIGEVSSSVVPRLGGVPITSLIGDQHAALLGHKCTLPRQCKITYGTGSFMLMNVGPKPVPSISNALLSTVAFKLGPSAPTTYALEGSVATAGRAVEWARQNLKIGHDVKEFNEIASSVPNTGGVTFVPALSGLFAPYWNDDARGVLVGMSLQSDYRHIARAVLEATAIQCAEVVRVMEKDAGMDSPMESIVVDGGMTKSDLLMQMQSDYLGCSVRRSCDAEVTAFGAAYAAGLAVGFWKQDKECSYDTFSPIMGQEEKDRTFSRWTDAVNRSFNLAKYSS